MTDLDRAIQAAVAEANRRYLEDLDAELEDAGADGVRADVERACEQYGPDFVARKLRENLNH